MDDRKKYDVIYADPPWKTKAGRALNGYKIEGGKQVFSGTDVKKSRDLAYPQMSVAEIAALNVKDLAAKDAMLFMWVTNQYLMKAEAVINAWGFKYSTAIVWSKKAKGGGLGGTFGITTEYLLFATRGKVRAKKKIVGTCFEVKRKYVNGVPCHSKKPDFFYDLIESISPGDNFLELFAREEREGWDAFGNEITNSITI